MDGTKAVEIARKTIDLWVRERKRYDPFSYPQEFDEKRGVFVTITSVPGKRLRGCIGFPEPVYPLLRCLQEAAIAACSEDPRFDPVREEELDRLSVEVSILTVPLRLEAETPQDLLSQIRIGRDGLIVRSGFRSGLLLPQVAEEYGWSPQEFLEQTCVKAGLDSDMWLSHETEVYVFQALVFFEGE